MPRIELKANQDTLFSFTEDSATYRQARMNRYIANTNYYLRLAVWSLPFALVTGCTLYRPACNLARGFTIMPMLGAVISLLQSSLENRACIFERFAASGLSLSQSDIDDSVEEAVAIQKDCLADRYALAQAVLVGVLINDDNSSTEAHYSSRKLTKLCRLFNYIALDQHVFDCWQLKNEGKQTKSMLVEVVQNINNLNPSDRISPILQGTRPESLDKSLYFKSSKNYVNNELHQQIMSYCQKVLCLFGRSSQYIPNKIFDHILSFFLGDNFYKGCEISYGGVLDDRRSWQYLNKVKSTLMANDIQLFSGHRSQANAYPGDACVINIGETANLGPGRPMPVGGDNESESCGQQLIYRR